MALMVTNLQIGIQNSTDRTVYASWQWTQKNTDHYDIEWLYVTGNVDTKGKPIYFSGSKTTTKSKLETYSAPSNATAVYIKVCPVSTEKTSGKGKKKKTTTWWVAQPASTGITIPVTPTQVPGKGAASNIAVSLQNDTDRMVYATWTWNQDHTDHYNIQWYYDTGNGVWFVGSDTTTNYKQATYSAPSNAKKVRFHVQPVSEPRADNTNTVYWTASWSTPYTFTIPDEPPIPSVSTVSKISVKLQTGVDRGVYATWVWTKANTDHYEIKWEYDSGDGIWFIGSETTSNYTQSTYTSPQNAKRVRVSVKPVAETRSGGSTPYWEANWSAAVVFDTPVALTVPSTPTVEIKGFTLTAYVSVYAHDISAVQFQIVKNDITLVKTINANLVTNKATVACTINAGDQYKVRARGYKGSAFSEWSEYSANTGTIPAKVDKISSIVALSSTSVKLTWTGVKNADNYEIQYTTQKDYFDTAPSEIKSTTVEAIVTTASITGLDTGQTWFFRVRATNTVGSGGWSGIAELLIGTVPAAPTTWSYTSTAKVGEDITLNWMHNSTDGSAQTAAQVELSVNGGTATVETVNGTTSTYVVHTDTYTDGDTIMWRVRTKGVMPDYGDWSTKRSAVIFAPPSIELGLYDNGKWLWDSFNFLTDTIYTAPSMGSDLIDTVTKFPIYIMAEAVPETQSAISFSVSIIARQGYDTTDATGAGRVIAPDEEIFNRYVDADSNMLNLMLSAGDIDLESGIEYTITVVAAMDSGLTAEASYDFTVMWEEDYYNPNANVSIDFNTLTAYIRPVCLNNRGTTEDNVLLSVYRREFDGTFTEIMSGLDGSDRTTIVDPHPALDYARYRIVAMSKSTGDVSFNDLPGVPIDHNAAVFQWDEEWTSFSAEETFPDAENVYEGSMLELPYNIDISIDHAPDVALANYIGRSHPVSYYGTQRGETARWQMDIPKDDEETIYSLRRLAIYRGDVYVREPSGTGYWAQVNVSYSITHNKPTVPVSMSITRVDGGI